MIPEGWKLVPVDPDPAMRVAGWESARITVKDIGEPSPLRIWAAMLEKAPEPPAVVGESESIARWHENQARKQHALGERQIDKGNADIARMAFNTEAFHLRAAMFIREGSFY